MTHRTLVILVCGGLLVAACGGSGDSPLLGGDPATSGPSVASEQFVEAGNALVDRWSDGDAFFVVMWALDLGYSPDQIIEAAATGVLNADGTISDPSGGMVGPERSPVGMLAIDGPTALTIRYVTAAYVDAADTEQSPRDAYIEDMDSWLGEAYGAGEQRLEELRRASEIETNLAAQVLELSARGYSQHQILGALLQFDVHAPAAYQAQFHAGLGPMCPYIEHNGVPVVPELEPSLLHGLECPPLPQPETSDDDPVEEVAEAGDVADYDGRYTAGDIDRDPGAIVEELSTSVEVLVNDGAVDGLVLNTSVVVYEEGGDFNPHSLTQQATQTVLLLGTVDAAGVVIGDGHSSASYVFVSCEPAEHCEGVTATPSGGEIAVTFTGSIQGDLLSVEVVNSVSGVTFSFEAQRE